MRTTPGSKSLAPGDDLSKGQYFVKTEKSKPINLLFAALFDLIICFITKMGLFVPSGAAGRNLDAIFAKKVPKIKDDLRKKPLVCAEILAYLVGLYTVLPSRTQL